MINSSKFLPSGKNKITSSNIKVDNVSDINSKLIVIEKKVIKIESFLKGFLTGQQKKAKLISRSSERQEFEDREKQLEKTYKVSTKINLPKLPTIKIGLFDYIKNFITNIITGLIVTKLLEYLPKFLTLLPLINNIMDTVIDWGGKLLDGLATFIDWGYKAVNASRTFVSNIFGESGAKSFDDFTSKFKDLVNYSLIAAMLISDFSIKTFISGKGGSEEIVEDIVDNVGDFAKGRGTQSAATQGVSGLAAAPAVAASVIAGVGLLSSALGEGAFQLKKITKGATEWIEKNPLLNNPLAGFILGPLKTGIWILNGLGTTLDIIGAPFRYAIELIRFGLMKMSGDEKGLAEQGKNLGKFDARVRDGIREHFSSFLSPMFRMLGKDDWAKSLEKEGSWGSLFGDKAVKDMYGHASGGITRGNSYASTDIKRKIKKKKVTRYVAPPISQISPGKSVGGDRKFKNTSETAIKTYYPQKTGTKEVKPFDFLMTAHKSLIGNSIGSLFSIATKSIFGDEPSMSDYRNASLGLNSWINTILDKLNIGYEQGEDEVKSNDIRDWLSTTIRSLISPNVKKIISDLMKQLTLNPTTGSGKKRTRQSRRGGGEGVDPNAQFQGQPDFVFGDSIAHGFAGRSGRGTDTSDTQAGRTPEKILAHLKSKGDALRDKLIDLSTGISNNLNDFTNVEEQLKYLKSLNARVRVIGISNQQSDTNGNINGRLETLVKKYGFYFYGGFNAGADRVHGNPPDYEALKQKLASTQITAGDNKIGEGSGNIRFGRTGSTIGLAPGWSHAHFENMNNGATSQSPTEPNLRKLVQDILPAVKRMASLGLKPELARGEPLLPGKDDAYYERLIRLGVSRHTHSGPKTAVDINMPGFPKVPFALKDVRNTPEKGQGINAILGNSNTTALFHLSFKPDGTAFHGGPITGLSPKIIKTHDDEYVIDKDSVELFGLPFIDLLNRIENVSQLKNNIDRLMTMLDYEDEGSKTYIIEEDDSDVEEKDKVFVINGQGTGSYSSQMNDEYFDYTVAQ